MLLFRHRWIFLLSQAAAVGRVQTVAMKVEQAQAQAV